MTELHRFFSSSFKLACGLFIALQLCACAAPAQPASQAAAGFDQQTPPPASGVTGITETLPLTLSANIPLTITGNLSPDLTKGEQMQLGNVDTGLNQQFATWLATTSVSVAELTPQLRAASPVVTVTVVLVADTDAPAVKEALGALNGAVIAEAGTMLSIQLPIGQLDQLSQVPGVALIQMPSLPPPVSQAYPLRPNDALAVSTVANGFAAPLHSPISSLTDANSAAAIDAWANSIPVDRSALAALKAQKQNYLALADTSANAAYGEWQASVMAAGDDSAQVAWDSQPTQFTLVMQDEAAALAARESLPALNTHILNSYGSWLLVSAPVGQIAALTQLPGVVAVQQPTMQTPVESASSMGQFEQEQPQSDPNAVNVVTEGVSAAKLNAWHTAGFRGRNVRVAIVDSFDQEIINDAFAHKEIPTKVLNGPSNSGADHGIAVTEIIYDMAPRATLSLNSVVFTGDYCIDFANTLVGLAAKGNQIISSSVGPTFCAGPADGATNPVTDASRRVRDEFNTFYVQAAGNNAEHHYEANFSEVQLDDDLVVHNFAPDSEDGVTVNVLSVQTEQGQFVAEVQQGQQLGFYLRWDGGWPQSSQDYDLYLAYFNGAAWVPLNCTPYPCVSQNVQDGSQMPLERIETFAPFTGAYGLIITKYNADGNHFLDLLTSHAQPTLSHYSVGRSLVDAAAHQYAFAIAAVDVSSKELESYSSRGPTYGTGNSANGGFAQPQLAAFANVNTYVSPGFNGTSSATPHVAGAAAVLKSAAACLSAVQLGNWLKNNALDAGDADYDFTFGAGILNFPAPRNRPSCVRKLLYMPLLDD